MRSASLKAWHRFHEQVEAQGGRVVEPDWLGANMRHRVVCRAGHETAPRPSDVNQGTGICRPCSGTDPVTTERTFRALIEERGGAVLEESWLGNKRPHRVICAQGHETTPRPDSVLNKGTGCIVCAGKDQGTAWRLFCQLVSERGGTVLEPKPLGVNRPHRVRCPEGHEARAIPSSVRQGGGMCITCSPVSRVRSEQRFRDLVAALGGSVLEPNWLGSTVPHRVICGQGHETAPRPNDARQTKSICRICAGHDSATSWWEFQAQVSALGGTVAEPLWLGNKKPHRVICGLGHECAVRPNNVQQGSSICRICASKVWDVFYVVVNDVAQTLKFGITSHDPRVRLRSHRKNGFERVIVTIIGVTAAQELENSVRATLHSTGMVPAKGREYFGLAALPIVLDAAAHWMADGRRESVALP